MGAKYYLTDVKAPKGELKDSGILWADEDRVVIEWYLWAGERPHVDAYAKKQGYIAIRYGDELYQLTSGKVQFRAFGVVESEVQQNLSIIWSLNTTMLVTHNGGFIQIRAETDFCLLETARRVLSHRCSIGVASLLNGCQR